MAWSEWCSGRPPLRPPSCSRSAARLVVFAACRIFVCIILRHRKLSRPIGFRPNCGRTPNTSTVSVAARVSTVTATAASSHQSTPPSSSSLAQTARPTISQVSLQAVLTPIVQQAVQQALQAAQTPAGQPVGPSSRPADPSYRPATPSPPAAQQLPQQGADSGSGGESRAPFPAFVSSVCLASAASAARAGAMLDRLASSSQSLPKPHLVSIPLPIFPCKTWPSTITSCLRLCSYG